MEIKQLKPSELKPYDKNNRKHPANQIDKLCKQIEAHGFDVPIVVDANNVIIKGHARVAAAKKLKLKSVPVIVRADLTPEQCAAARLADNKLSELAEVDMAAIQAELDALQAINFDLDLTAFDSWRPFDEEDKKDDESTYTRKVEVPIYEPTKPEKPKLSEIVDRTRYDALMSEIETSEVPEKDKELLRLGACRHLQFDYQQVAEYYAHSDKNVQELMENSAMVIIDFKKAIELGFVKLTDEIANQYKAENDV